MFSAQNWDMYKYRSAFCSLLLYNTSDSGVQKQRGSASWLALCPSCLVIVQKVSMTAIWRALFAFIKNYGGSHGLLAQDWEVYNTPRILLLFFCITPPVRESKRQGWERPMTSALLVLPCYFPKKKVSTTLMWSARLVRRTTDCDFLL